MSGETLNRDPEILRRTAALMRERAEAATPGPWHVCEGDEHAGDWTDQRVSGPGHEPIAALDGGNYESDPGEPSAENDADHIASWHPDVALAVADLLESTANDVEHVHDPIYNLTSTTVARVFAVARKYLGEQA